MIRRIVLVLALAIGGCLTGAPAAASPCSASGTSDGVVAQSFGQCRRPPDGLVLEPLACARATFDLVVEDDTAIAVFSDRIVADLDRTHGENGVALRTSDGLSAPPFGQAPVMGDLERRFSATGRWWSRTCWALNPESGRWVGAGTDGPHPEGPERELGELVAEARARLNPPDVPVIRFAGPVSVVQLPTWFWVDRSWWSRYYRAASSHGAVAVSVAAAPVRWNLRNADEGDVLVSCEGRGAEWRRGMDHEGCTHAFDEPASLRLELTVELEASWTTSLPGYGVQVLPSLWRASIVEHSAVEVVGMRGS